MSSNGNFQMWEDGKENSPLQLWRVCPCRTCQADAKGKGVGYLLTSDDKGAGVTIWVPNEAVYLRMGSCGIEQAYSATGISISEAESVRIPQPVRWAHPHTPNQN